MGEEGEEGEEEGDKEAGEELGEGGEEDTVRQTWYCVEGRR